MIIENINETKQQIKQLYEYVNGVKQPISKRYEYVDGRKELVFKNKTIKEITLVDSNGNPLNGMSGGTKIRSYEGSSYIYGSVGVIYDTTTTTYNLSGLNLGTATGKNITKLKGTLYGYFHNSRTWSSYPLSNIKLNNISKYQKRWEYRYITYGSIYDYKIVSGGWVNFEIAPNMITNNLSIETSELHKYSGSAYDGSIWIGFKNLIVEYEE